jgi:hypothetical protein
MDDGPTDFESGYFFEGQKRIQDRRNALGLDQRQSRPFTSLGHDAHHSDGGGGGGSFVATLIVTAIYYAGLAMIWIVIGAIWLMGQIIVAIFFRRR